MMKVGIVFYWTMTWLIAREDFIAQLQVMRPPQIIWNNKENAGELFFSLTLLKTSHSEQKWLVFLNKISHS